MDSAVKKGLSVEYPIAGAMNCGPSNAISAPAALHCRGYFYPNVGNPWPGNQ
jgi:hypothetical protein